MQKASVPTNRFLPIAIAAGLTIAVAAVTMPLSSCGRFFSSLEPIHGTGPIVKSSPKVDEFDAVQLDGAYEVVLSQTGAVPSITIETDSNLIPYITAKVKNGKLIVTSEGDLHPTRDIKLVISSPKYSSVVVDGSATVHGGTPLSSDKLELSINGSGSFDLELHTKQLSTNIAGSGHYALRGATVSHTMDITGAGEVIADSMMCESAKADISGSGKAALLLSKALDATVTGSGHITYRGSVSELHTSISGSGGVEKIQN